jgi:hypothetical protein
MDPETGCRYDFQLPLSSERPSITRLPCGCRIRGSATGIQPFHACVGESEAGGYSPYSLPHWDVDMPAFDNFISFTAPWRYAHRSPALENLRIEDCPLLKDSHMDAFKALQATHSNCALRWFLPSLDACTQLESLQIRAVTGCRNLT